MTYQYRGTIRDVEEPAPKRRTKPQGTFNPDACGTYAGYRRHQRHKIPFCEPCREAQRSYDRDYTERYRTGQLPPQRTFQPEKCGTVAGHAQHYRHGTERCQPCKTAWREYLKDWKKRNQ